MSGGVAAARISREECSYTSQYCEVVFSTSGCISRTCVGGCVRALVYIYYECTCVCACMCLSGCKYLYVRQVYVWRCMCIFIRLEVSVVFDLGCVCLYVCLRLFEYPHVEMCVYMDV
jgi:hypothetical protein